MKRRTEEIFQNHEDILKTLKSYCWKDLINQKTNSNSRFWLCQKLPWTLAGLIGTRKNSLKYLTATTVKPPKKKCRNVLTLCKIGSPVYWILFHHLRQTRIIRTRFLSTNFPHCCVKILVNPLGLTAFCALHCKKSAT